jgi:carbon storage regulator
MLVIRRRAGESILVGTDIEIEVLEAGSNRVKLGIVGPRSTQVVRKEVKLTADNNLSAGSLSLEMRDLIVKKIARIPQAGANPSDKPCESEYSGHPVKKENLGPT